MNSKLFWCLNQPKGVKLVEPSENISESYFTRANDDLAAMDIAQRSWKVIIGYYACYSALYALLIKAGIKSEIHDCTLEFLKLIEGFATDDYEFLSELKKNRIDVQYYLKERELKDSKRVKEFIFKCKVLAENLDVTLLRAKVDNG